MQFTALEDFWCDETQSFYVKGLSYTVRPASDYSLADMPVKTANQIRGRCNALAALFPQWITSGKIRQGGPAGGSVRGS